MDKKEIIISATKSIFGVIPYGGAALDELFFEYSGRVKQNRLNKFVEILAENFTQDSGLNIENIKTEDFNDLFESVLKRVVQTNSELKLIRFKNILIKELSTPTEQTELIDHYLDLISDLTEEEIGILHNHRYFTIEFEEKIDELNLHRDNLTSLEQQLKNERLIIEESKFRKPYNDLKIVHDNLKEHIDSFAEYKKAKYYDLSDNKFMFYKQRLFSKGLLIDNRMSRVGSLPFGNMGITEFGIEFIEFIKNTRE